MWQWAAANHSAMGKRRGTPSSYLVAVQRSIGRIYGPEHYIRLCEHLQLRRHLSLAWQQQHETETRTQKHREMERGQADPGRDRRLPRSDGVLVFAMRIARCAEQKIVFHILKYGIFIRGEGISSLFQAWRGTSCMTYYIPKDVHTHTIYYEMQMHHRLDRSE
jgi:hypothetical protein